MVPICHSPGFPSYTCLSNSQTYSDMFLLANSIFWFPCFTHCVFFFFFSFFRICSQVAHGSCYQLRVTLEDFSPSCLGWMWWFWGDSSRYFTEYSYCEFVYLWIWILSDILLIIRLGCKFSKGWVQRQVSFSFFLVLNNVSIYSLRISYRVLRSYSFSFSNFSQTSSTTIPTQLHVLSHSLRQAPCAGAGANTK